uniref:lymphotoxin-alpha n=1 Tax=Scatophagus argus TaxID=75038 RepID=UPI001ED8412F|nr:lymphotoxin-alpha [Scatophagus argus]
MEMLDGSGRLIREWETSGMEEDGFFRGVDARSHRHHTNTSPNEARLQRMVQFLAVAILLLTSVVLALLVTVLLGGRTHEFPSSQPTAHPVSKPPGINFKQPQQQSNNPRAMLTAPTGSHTDGKYLQWESNDGHAFCHGGFNYSSGDLVVPRSGLYRVFLQITYESKDKHNCDELKLINKVFVFRDSYPHDVPLLSSVDTVSYTKPWSKSLYTDGLFFLEANCRLHVTSSCPDLIIKREYQVFFGAELMPQ